MLKNKTLNESFFHVTYLNQPVIPTSTNRILAKLSDDEVFHFDADVIYLYCPNRYGKTKLTNQFLKIFIKLKQPHEIGKL